MIERARLAGTDLDFYPLDSAHPVRGERPLAAPDDGEGAARRHRPPGRGRHDRREGMSARWRAGRPRLPRTPSCPSCPRASSCRTSRACPRRRPRGDALRDEARRAATQALVDPLVPVDLVIDHSVQVDSFGFRDSYTRNVEQEFERNRERYALLRWAPAGVPQLLASCRRAWASCHQVNLEHVAKVVQVREIGGRKVAIPDTLMGTDSHTTMVNGLGVLGWGVGGIEAEAVMLGQPLYLAVPDRGRRQLPRRAAGGRDGHRPGADAHRDAAQARRGREVRRVLRRRALDPVAARPRDHEQHVPRVRGDLGALPGRRRRRCATWRSRAAAASRSTSSSATPRSRGCSATMATRRPSSASCSSSTWRKVEPSLAGPKRPQDRVSLPKVWDSFTAAFGNGPKPSGEALSRLTGEGGPVNGRASTAVVAGPEAKLENGCVVIAAITSCTNTSNPSVMVAAGLLAKKAVELGLQVNPYVKTSLAPGSRVVTDYLETADLMKPLEKLGFFLVGYGCTTCIGNSGPLASPEVEAAVVDENLSVVAVLSGNRNFECAHPPAGQSELPRLAAARRRLCARRVGEHRPHEGPHRPHARWETGDAVRPLALAGRGQRRRAEGRAEGHVQARVRAHLRGRRALEEDGGANGADLPVGREVDLREGAALLRRAAPSTRGLARRRGRARARGARRFGHHRPHLSRGVDPRRQPWQANT